MHTRIYLVRHGETDWNSGGKFQGHSDIPLSGKGREQAIRLAKRLKDVDIHGIYSSDLCRARETAEIVAKPHQLTVQTMTDLREINFGGWEGLTYQEITEKFGESYSCWCENPLMTRIPSGESLQDVVDRCSKAMQNLILQHPGETLLVVAHGGVIRTIVGTSLGINMNLYWKLKVDHVSLSILEYHGLDKAILELYNETCHMNP